MDQYNERVTLRISGKVQGVYFRASTQETARALCGITGWVRNCPDGGVEVLAEGPRAELEALVQWCHDGPRAARVDQCAVRWSLATEEFAAFTIQHEGDDDPHGPDGER